MGVHFLREGQKIFHSIEVAWAKALWLEGECYILGTDKKANVSIVQKI